MPETSHLSGPELREAGVKAGQEYVAGFKSSSGGAEQMGGEFAKRFTDSFNKQMGGSMWSRGIFGNVIERTVRDAAQIGEQVNATLAKKLGQQLPQLRQEYQQTTAEMFRMREALHQVRVADDQAVAAGRGTVAMLRERRQAESQYEVAGKNAVAAQQKYNSTLKDYTEASASARTGSTMLAGAMGGLAVLGVQAVISGFEKLIELGAHIFEDAVHGAEEIAHRLVDIGEAYQQLNIQTVEFSGATGEALQSMQDHVSAVFGQLDVAGKDLGRTYAQLGSILNLKPGPELDELAKSVEELQGRFTNLKAADIGAVFKDFKVPADQVNSALDTLVTNATNSGQAVGDLVAALKGDAAETLSKAGLDLGASAHVVGELEKAGIPAEKVMMGLASAQKEFTKEGRSFPDGIREAAKELTALGNTAAGDQLAQTLFGRKWVDAAAIANELNAALGATPGQFDGAANAAKNLIDNTEDLGNKISEFRHHAEQTFKPFADGARDAVEHGLSLVSTWFDTHHDQIIQKIRSWGTSFIEALPKIKDFAVTAAHIIEAFAVAAMAALGPLMEGMIGASAAVLFATGHFKEAGQMLKLGLDIPMAEGAGLKMFNNALNALDKINIDTDKWVAGLNTAADAASGIRMPEGPPSGYLGGGNASFGAPGGGGGSAPSTPGLPGTGPVGGPGGPAAPGHSPVYGPPMPSHAGGAPARPGASAAPSAAPGGGSFGSVEETMRSRIGQDAEFYGLTPVETQMIIGVGKHESNWQGPGYMGFGPEAKAQGLDFSNDPFGAVDQFFKQFVERRAKEGDPNDPQAVANYIWHTVHGAADTNYGPELLAAAGFGSPSHAHKGMHVQGDPTIHEDHVPILAEHGEFVVNKDSYANPKYRQLINFMNGNPKGFKGGGLVGPAFSQVIWTNTETGQNVGENDGQWVGPGTSQPGFYHDDWSGHTGHVHTTVEHNPFTGELYDQVKAGTNISQGKPGFPDWVYQLGDQYGVMPSTYPGHQEWGGVNHGIDWWPKDATPNMQGSGYTHEDHVTLTDFAQTVGQSATGTSGSAGSAGSGVQLVDNHSGGGPHGGGGRGGGNGGSGGFGGGGPGGSMSPGGFPGMPGQYGGYGQYGGETLDQVQEHERAIRHSRDRVNDIQNKDIPRKQQDVDKLQAEYDKLNADVSMTRDTAKIAELQQQLSDAKDDLNKLKTETLPEAQQDVDTAQRRQAEAADKPPSERGGKSGSMDSAAKSLGSSLLGGISQSLGFPDVFGGKSPAEWGITKLFGSVASYGFGLFNALGDAGGRLGGGAPSGVGPNIMSGLGGSMGMPSAVKIAMGQPGFQGGTPPVQVPGGGNAPLFGGPSGVAPGTGVGMPSFNMKPQQAQLAGFHQYGDGDNYHGPVDQSTNNTWNITPKTDPQMVSSMQHYANSTSSNAAMASAPGAPPTP